MSVVEHIRLGVVVERRRVDQPWLTERWRVVDVLPDAPEAVAAGTVLAQGDGRQRMYAGAVEVELYAGDTGAYRDNLTSSRPAVYVVLRRRGDGYALHGATVDPGEIEAHADAGDDLIEAVPLPPGLAARIAAFVERPFHKRQRTPADPEALGRPPGPRRERRAAPVAPVGGDGP